MLLVPALAGAALVYARLGWVAFAASACSRSPPSPGTASAPTAAARSCSRPGSRSSRSCSPAAGRRALVAAVAGVARPRARAHRARRGDGRVEPRHARPRRRPGRPRRRPRRPGRALLGAGDVLVWRRRSRPLALLLVFALPRRPHAPPAGAAGRAGRPALARRRASASRSSSTTPPTDVLLVGIDRLRRRGGRYASRPMARARSRSSSPSVALVFVAGCGGAARSASPAPETVVGTHPGPPTETGGGTESGGAAEGDPTAGKEVFASAGCGSCHTLSDAGATGTVGPNLDDSSVDVAAAVTAGHERRRRDASVQRLAERAADRRRGRVRRRRARQLSVPAAGLPARGRRLRVRPRPHADLGGRRAAPAHAGRDRAGRAPAGSACSSSPGRMFRSVRPYLEQAGHRRSGRLLPGRRRRRPGDRASSSATSRSRSSSRERSIATLRDGGLPRQLLRRRRALRRRGDARGRALRRLPAASPSTPSATSSAWLSEPPTKLVAIDEPDVLDGLEARMKERFAGRLYISKSLPYFLEFASPDVTKGSGLAFLAERLGFTRRAHGRLRGRRERRRAARVGRLRRRGRERPRARARGRRLGLPLGGRGGRRPGDRVLPGVLDSRA